MIARFLIFLAASGFLFAENASYRIYSECDENTDVRAQIQKDTPLSIRFAIAGGSPCYSVTASVNGKEIRGFVLDRSLDAVRAFDEARARNDRDSFEHAPVAAAVSQAAAAPKAAVIKEAEVKVVPKTEKKEPPPHKLAR